MSDMENTVNEDQTLAEQEVDTTSEASEPEEFNLDSIFDLPKTGFESENREVTSEEEPTQPVADESAPKDADSYKYWQSQADKRTSELNKVMETLGVENPNDLDAKLNKLKNLEPISEHILNNPEILSSVKQDLSNGQAVGNPQENQVQPLKKPEMPKKPTNYDADDALADPTSESYKYREALDNYRDDMLLFQDARFEQMAQQQMVQQEAMQQEQDLQNVRKQLTSDYEMSSDDADKFIQTMSDPQSINMDNLVALFKMQNGTQDVQAPAPASVDGIDPKMQEMMSERQRLATPSPVTAAKGEANTSTSSDEDNIIENMIGNYKRNNPW